MPRSLVREGLKVDCTKCPWYRREGATHCCDRPSIASWDDAFARPIPCPDVAIIDRGETT